MNMVSEKGMEKVTGICLIGAGRAGMIHARNFASRVPCAKVTAIADTVQDFTQQITGKRSKETMWTPWWWLRPQNTMLMWW